MLHDPRHDNEPTLAAFALFVASKPEHESYLWKNCRKCAVGQYLESIGRDIGMVDDWPPEMQVANDIARGPLDQVPLLESLSPEWTFGKLADRILAHQMA